MISYACPHCNTQLQIPEQYVGKAGRCRKCGNTFTVAVQQAAKPAGANGASKNETPPTLIAVHIETSGPSTRKCGIIEIAGVKVNLDGREQDTFWTFVNPDQLIPTKIVDRTGITDGMVAQAPYAIEAVQEFFQWAGPNALLFTHHCRFQSKFISAALLNEDIEPPDRSMIDVVEWAADVAVPAEEYKLIPLLKHFNQPVPEGHRALETAQGIVRLFIQMVAVLRRNHPELDSGGGGLRGLLHRNEISELDRAVFQDLREIATPMSKNTGEKFSARAAYEARKAAAQGGHHTPVRPMHDSKGYHKIEWFEETRRVLEAAQRRAPSWSDSDSGEDYQSAPWTFSLLEASQCESPEEEQKYLLQAIDLGANDPWPYERLTGFFIQGRDYLSAQKVISKFFDTDGWSQPRNSETSLKLLERMQKIERRLSQAN